MPPPGHEPFLKAICENPDDDTVRLVYADWLEENGDPERAEFIRCQVVSAGNTHPKNPAFRRSEILRKANATRWRAELPRLPGVDWGAFQRGFVSIATLKGNWHGHEAFAQIVQVAPVREIVLAHCKPHAIYELVRSPHLVQIRRLESRAGYANDESIEALAACSAASTLEILTLPGGFWASVAGGRGMMPVITDRAALALATAQNLTRLRSLTFDVAHMTEIGIAALQQRFGNGFKCHEVIPTPPPDSPFP